MDSGIIELSKYRFEVAQEDLDASKLLFCKEKYKPSINRSYYAIFHALRAVTALDGFDSRKHSGIIAFFNRTYVKTGIFDRLVSKNIDKAFRIREKADYQDFFAVSESDAENQIADAEELLDRVKGYLISRWNTD